MRRIAGQLSEDLRRHHMDATEGCAFEPLGFEPGRGHLPRLEIDASAKAQTGVEEQPSRRLPERIDQQRCHPSPIIVIGKHKVE